MSYRAYTLISYLIVIVSLSFSYPTYSKNEIISKHDYKLYKSNIHFASTTYILSKSESDFTFQIISRTDGIFKLKKDDRKETSVFKKHGDKVDPVSYIFSRKKWSLLLFSWLAYKRGVFNIYRFYFFSFNYLE